MIRQFLERMWGRLTPNGSVAEARPALSPEMTDALALWYDLYRDRAPWKRAGTVKSLNLPAMIAGEIARQVALELKWNITPAGDGPGDAARAAWLKDEAEKLMAALRGKLEQGCAAGGMLIKPWVNPEDGHIYFDFAMDWGLRPMAFDPAGGLCDVVIPDVFRADGAVFTRLERHRLVGGDAVITQRAFRSAAPGTLGKEIALSDVPRWAALPAEARVAGAGGPLFGWFRVAAANNVDVGCPMGASVYGRAVDLIREADMQYSRLLWEFEGGELAVDVDPTALRPRQDGRGRELPRLNERLFRAVDTGAEATYQVFAPTLRDESLIRGLNQLLTRIEDLCGLSRGTLSDPSEQARTATELKILRQRSYATIADNQRALEVCLRDVLRAMDRYATAYGLAPEGEYAASFEWDDGVLTDAGEQLKERLALLEAGVIDRVELRQWYLGETEAQAREALGL